MSTRVALTAVKIPVGIAMTTASSRANSVSRSVVGMRSRTSARAGER